MNLPTFAVALALLAERVPQVERTAYVGAQVFDGQRFVPRDIVVAGHSASAASRGG